MAGTIDAGYRTNETLYFHVRDKNGKVWNGSAFETFATANYANYDVSLTEEGSCGYYKGTFPAAISAGRYRIVFYNQSGAAAADGDSFIGSYNFRWDGTNEVSLDTDTLDELSSGAPAKNPTFKQAMMFLYMLARNKTTSDKVNLLFKVFNDAGSAIASAAISDDGSVATKGEFGAP